MANLWDQILADAEAQKAAARTWTSMSDPREAAIEDLRASRRFSNSDYMSGLQDAPLTGATGSAGRTGQATVDQINEALALMQDENPMRRQAAISAYEAGVPLSTIATLSTAGELMPIYGTALGAIDAAQAAPSMVNNLAQGNYGAAGADALAMAGGLLDIVPAAGVLADPIARGMRSVDTGQLAADIQGIGRSIASGDLGQLGEVFQPAGAARSLSAGTPNQQSITNPLAHYSQEAIDNSVPFTRTSGYDAPRVGGRGRDDALYPLRFSKAKQVGVAPSDWTVSGRRVVDAISPAEFVTAEDIANRGYTDLQGFTADATMGNAIVDQINGLDLPQPVVQQAGHEFTDNLNDLGFMSDAGVLAGKNNVWQQMYADGRKPLVTPMAMGGSAGDFGQHQAMTMAQAIRAAAENGMIDPNYRPIGGTGKNPIEVLPPNMGLLDARLPAYIESLNGGQRAQFMKALDKPAALNAGVPSVGAVRWALTDPNLLDAELLSSGYRLFQPAQDDFLSYPFSHASYNAAVGREGNSMTMGNTRPWTIMFPDLAAPKILANPKQTAGSNIMVDLNAKPKDLRAFQMNPNLSQTIDPEWVDMNMRYDEILRNEGKYSADMYAMDAMMSRMSRRGGL